MGGAGGSYWAICWLFYVQVLFFRHSGPRLYPLTKSVGHQTSFLSCPSTCDVKKYPLVQKEAVRLEFSRAVEEYNAELKNINGKNYF